ncbi:peptide-methionine (R)-S-oxide reductase MsrB [Tropicibacter oceani]|uniref:peptide-methionine (R)-S-oxide reductase n=1 Tax=Tropicibacter oceani TaxID=3058420 RepID=A0ABY8QFA1_9RHOB|nr:peptide-methionine (R)-S-oxide reductase MsrB [Tropicibacter oceani]WGW03285.1 peptide-methionine (R)-S-oxide reductase MsrB [Tropicibacter oceani]
MKRRHFLQSVTATAAATLFARSAQAASGSFEVTRTKAQWKAMLSPLEYKVMREEGTERAFTSPLDKNTKAGTYLCRGCDLPLYSSQHKFDSGTGWPSFYQALPRAVGTKPDRSLFGVRTECHCRRCGSHLGHIFDDGPAPTGKRHCINGVSLKFAAA